MQDYKDTGDIDINYSIITYYYSIASHLSI
jgi:hypothetical protein